MIFKVKQIIIPRKTNLERKKYLLSNIEDGNTLKTHDSKDKWFYASSLIDAEWESDMDIGFPFVCISRHPPTRHKIHIWRSL